MLYYGLLLVAAPKIDFGRRVAIAGHAEQLLAIKRNHGGRADERKTFPFISLLVAWAFLSVNAYTVLQWVFWVQLGHLFVLPSAFSCNMPSAPCRRLLLLLLLLPPPSRLSCGLKTA